MKVEEIELLENEELIELLNEYEGEMMFYNTRAKAISSWCERVEEVLKDVEKEMQVPEGQVKKGDLTIEFTIGAVAFCVVFDEEDGFTCYGYTREELINLYEGFKEFLLNRQVLIN